MVEKGALAALLQRLKVFKTLRIAMPQIEQVLAIGQGRQMTEQSDFGWVYPGVDQKLVKVQWHSDNR